MATPVNIEFSGGAELIAGNIKKHAVELPAGQEWTMKQVIQYVKENLITERHELFVQGDTVRPGILVLINDTDWELMDELAYKVKAKDTIIFISTLHGG